jgi:methionine-gamma-lyase
MPHIKNIDETFGFATRSVHAGNEIDKETGAIRRPITMANSYELPYDPSDLNWSSVDGNIYTRNGSANQGYLQEKLRLLHKVEDCVVLASGVAALMGVFFVVLKSGDHVVVSDSTYIAAYRLLHELLPESIRLNPRFLGENDERQYLYPQEFHGGFFRLSVGLEDTVDLINDIKQALRG